mgnify:CR=1 FL=1
MLNKLKQIHFAYYLPFLAIPAIFLFILLSSSVNNLVVTDTNGKKTEASLPFTSVNKEVGVFHISFDFNTSFLFSGRLLIIPDDCVLKILINNQPVSDYYYDNLRCEYNKGFELILSDLKNGTNHFEFLLENKGGSYGLKFIDRTYYFIYYFLFVACCFIPLIYREMKKRNISVCKVCYAISAKRVEKRYIVSIAGILLFFTVLKFTNFFPSVTVYDNGVYKDVSVPYSFHNRDNAKLSYKVSFNNIFLAPNYIHIIPDDCVTDFNINGKNALALINQEGICDWENGFKIKTDENFKKGENIISITVQNNGGKGGINILYYNEYAIWLLLLCFLLILTPVFISLRNNIKFGNLSVLLIIISAVLWLNFWGRHSFQDLGHDISYGHMPYLNYVFSNFTIPHSTGGWSFFHPSLYYIVVACVWLFSTVFGETTFLFQAKITQIVSMLFFLAYLYFAFRIVWLVFQSFATKQNINVKGFSFNFSLIITYLFITFWPMNVVIANRIGNDISLYAFFIASVFYFLRYLDSELKKHLVLTLIFAVLAMWSKANGIILFGLIGASLIVQNKFNIFNRNLLKKILIISLFMGIGVFVGMNETINNISRKESYVSNVNLLSNDLKVNNSIANFVKLDIITFISEPFTNPFHDEKGRQMFWHYLLKTALFGEFKHQNKNIEYVAQIISILFIFLFTLMLIALIFLLKYFKQLYLFYIWILFALAFHIIFRLSYPYACSGDFRYVYHLVIVCSLLFGLKMSSIKNKLLKGFIYPITIIFLLAAIFFQYTIVFC